MLQTINQTTISAKNAEAALINAIDNATTALDGIARDPLAESLARLAEAAEAAQARLLAGRMRANALLMSALLGFQAFEAELSPVEEEAVIEVPPVAELPAPVVTVAPEPEPAPADEVVTATAANPPVEVGQSVAPLSPDWNAEDDHPVPNVGDDYPRTDWSDPHASEAAEEPTPPASKKGRGRKGKA